MCQLYNYMVFFFFFFLKVRKEDPCGWRLRAAGWSPTMSEEGCLQSLGLKKCQSREKGKMAKWR